MAFDSGITTPNIKQTVNNSANTNADFTNRLSSIDSLTFGGLSSGITLLSPIGKGSEYSNAIKNNLIKTMKDLPDNHGINILLIDKETRNDLSYSTIVAYKPDENGDIKYIAILLTDTGPLPVTAVNMANDIKMLMSNKNYVPSSLYVPSDANNDNLHKIIRIVLNNTLNNGNYNYISLAVLSLPANTAIDNQNLYTILSAYIYNVFKIEQHISKHIEADINVANILKAIPDKQFIAEVYTSNGNTTKDILGKPLRADFMLNLTLNDKRKQNDQMFNIGSGKEELAKITGYVDGICVNVRKSVPVPNNVMNNVVDAVAIAPYIIITGMELKAPSLGFALFALAASTIMLDKRCYIGALMPKEDSTIVQAGELNMITKLSGEPVAINLLDKKVDQAQKFQILESIFSEPPILALDIPVCGINSYSLAALATAAYDPSYEARDDAARYIIDTAYWLTGGRFNQNFPKNEIFQNAIIVPNGIWISKTGERDIRDCDLAMVTKFTNGQPQEIYKYDTSHYNKEITNLDNFTTKVQIVASVLRDSIITDKSIRVTFTSKFISELITALSECGVVFNYEPEYQITEAINYGTFANRLISGGSFNNNISQVIGRSLNQSYTPYNLNTFAHFGGYNFR